MMIVTVTVVLVTFASLAPVFIVESITVHNSSKLHIASFTLVCPLLLGALVLYVDMNDFCSHLQWRV